MWIARICLGWGVFGAATAADIALDCNVAAGYQPCSASLDSARFSPDGIALSAWPGGSNILVLPSASGPTTVTVEGTKSLGGMKVKGSRYTVAGTGALNLAMAPTVFDLDSAARVTARLVGSVDLEKRGSGTLDLLGANSWTGQLRVFRDTVRLGNDSALGNVEALTSAEAGGVLDLAGRSVGTEMTMLNGGALINQDTAASSPIQRLTVVSDSRIGGNGRILLKRLAHPSPFLSVKAGTTLTKTDTGVVEFHGIPFDHEGTLRLSQGAVSFHYGVKYQGTGGIQLDSGTRIEFANDSPGVVLPYPVRMDGGLIGVYNGLARTELANDLVLSGDFRNVLNVKTPLLVSGRISGAPRVLTKWSEGTAVLTGENTFTGILAIESGEVRVGDGGESGSLSCDSIRDNGALVFHQSGTRTYAGGIHGTGSLAREGTGTTVLTGNVAPGSGTSVRAGTLQVGAGGTGGSIRGTLDIAGSLVVDRAGTMVHADTLRGAGSLVKRGAGTLVLSGPNAFRGPTRIDAGVLRIDAGADSSAVEVRSGSTLEGRGRVGAVDLQGILRPGSDSAIGVLSVASLAIGDFTPATVRIRARGSSKPGVEYDRVAATGAVALGTAARLELDLTGLAKAGTITGVLQGASLTGTFDTLLLTGDSGWIVALRYTSRSVDAVVVRDSSGDSLPDTTVVPPPPVSDTLDTLLVASSDTARLVLRGAVDILAPPRAVARRVKTFLRASPLGRGIRGADTAVVVDASTDFGEPLLVRLPLALVPVGKRLPGEWPSVFRIDPGGDLLLVPSIPGTDSTLAIEALSPGSFWLGYDTIAPVVALVVDRESLGVGQSAHAEVSLLDNVASTVSALCLLLPGSSPARCDTLATGDSTRSSRRLEPSETPFGATIFARAVDSRRIVATDSTDLVVFLDSLPNPPTRLEDAYELLSLPYQTAPGSAIATFRGLWGTPDARRWRAWGWDSSAFTEVLDSDPRSLAGNAWWIRSRGIARTWTIASAWTWPVSRPFEVVLEPGWNLVGNPFGFPVDWTAVRRLSGLDSLGVVGPYRRDDRAGTWMFPDPSGVIPAWAGAAVYLPGREVARLRIPSRSDAVPAARASSRDGWTGVSLRWVQGNRVSSWLHAGLATDQASRAPRAVPLPPAPDHALVGWIQGASGRGPLLGDFRLDQGGGDEWTLVVEGVGADGPLHLEMVRQGIDTATAVRLRESVASSWTALGDRTPLPDGAAKRTYVLAIGGISRGVGAKEALAVRIRSGILEWTLPAEAGRGRVRIEIRDLSGRILSVPVDEVMDPGSYRRTVGIPRASRARVVVLRAAGAFRTSHFADLR